MDPDELQQKLLWLLGIMTRGEHDASKDECYAESLLYITAIKKACLRLLDEGTYAEKIEFCNDFASLLSRVGLRKAIAKFAMALPEYDQVETKH